MENGQQRWSTPSPTRRIGHGLLWLQDFLDVIIGEIWAYVAIPVLLIALLIYKRGKKKKRKRELKDELIAKEYSHPAFEKEVPEFAFDDGLSSEGHYDATPEEWGEKEEVEAPPPTAQDEPKGPDMPASPHGKKGKSFEDIMGWE